MLRPLPFLCRTMSLDSPDRWRGLARATITTQGTQVQAGGRSAAHLEVSMQHIGHVQVHHGSRHIQCRVQNGLEVEAPRVHERVLGKCIVKAAAVAVLQHQPHLQP